MELKLETSNPKPPYAVFNHTADLGLEIYGSDEAKLFSSAAFALFDIMTDIDVVEIKEVRSIAVEGSDWDDLLVNFLREVLYMFHGEGILLKDFSVFEIDSHHLVGEVKGEHFDPERHTVKTEIKAVTYHHAEVKEAKEGWKARVIFDV